MIETTVEQKHIGPRFFLVLIVLLSAFAPISTDMYLPALGQIVDELGTDESTLNMTLYAFMFVMAISILLMGPISDKYGRKKPLIACLIEYIVTMIACSFVTDVYMMILFRALQAIGAGGVLTISTAFIKDSYSGPIMGKVVNIVAIIGVIGPVIAPIAGSALIDSIGWRHTFTAPAIFALVCLAFTLFVTETLPSEQRVSGGLSKMLGGMKNISRNRSYMLFMVMFCMFNLPFMAYLSVSSYIYEGMFGLSGSMYSILLAVTLFASVMVMVVITKVTSKTVSRKVLPLFLVMGLIGSILLILIGKTGWIAFLVSFLFIISASSTVRPWGMGILMRSCPGDNGTLSAMINFMFFMMGTVGMVLSTLPWPTYVDGLGILGLLASALYLVLMLALRSMKQNDVTALDKSTSDE